MTGTAAYVRNRRLDILYANQLARALYSELYRDPTRPRFVFLDARATDFYTDWDSASERCSSAPASGSRA